MSRSVRSAGTCLESAVAYDGREGVSLIADWQRRVHPCWEDVSSGLVFGRREVGSDRAEADDELDAVSNRHVQPRNLFLRHQHEETAGWIGGGRHENAEDVFPGFLLHFFVVFPGEKANRIRAGSREFHE